MEDLKRHEKDLELMRTLGDKKTMDKRKILSKHIDKIVKYCKEGNYDKAAVICTTNKYTLEFLYSHTLKLKFFHFLKLGDYLIENTKN